MNTRTPPLSPDPTAFVRGIRIASPCPARWEDMTGDDRARVCASCSKHVYNLSALTAGEVAALVREKEGCLCGRFYQRTDGTMLTADCPVGLATRSVRRMKALAFATVLTVLGALGAQAHARSLATRRDGARPPGRVARQCDELLWRLKGFMGIRRPGIAVAGQICIPPPPTNAAPTAAGK